MPVLAAVKLGDLVEVIWVSLLAGVGITAVFSLVVYTSGRAGEARRAHRSGEATVFAGLSVLFFAAFVFAVIYGMTIMLSKD